MSIVRTFGDLAQEFLEQQVEAFEFMLASEGEELVIDEYEYHDKWDSYTSSFDPLINVTLYLFGSKEVCIDCLKEEGYSIIHEELDAFLIRKGDPTYIGIDKSSDIYKVLARRFLVAEIDAFGIMEGICIGEPFEYKYKQGVSNLELDGTNKNSTYLSASKWKRARQINIQNMINGQAEVAMQKFPKLNKKELAEYLFKNLYFGENKKLKTGTIYKDYLDNF